MNNEHGFLLKTDRDTATFLNFLMINTNNFNQLLKSQYVEQSMD